ncbi:MAG TPA: hypothetical protein VNH38_02655 [Candidatus Dormibacteraeota bacterium]|nr:hypothetical protein [Candidatus Dormibacteraeota bacterium]
MATRANANQAVAAAAKSRARRPVARAKSGAATLAPSYQPMWALADQSIETVAKGLRLLPPRFGRN